MKLTGPFSQILTLRGLPLKGPLHDEMLEIIPEGGVLTNGGRFQAVGDFNTLRKSWPQAEVEEIASEGVLMPGFIDCHTHMCWHGTRSSDFAQRNAGKSYLEIAGAGGGIWSTVLKTREASLQELIDGLVLRARRHFSDGITTVEVKSGYGLDFDTEIKMLRAIREADKESDIEFISTCLAAHMKPRDFDGSNGEYLRWVLSELLPFIRQEGLSQRVDVFIEKTAFGVEEGLMFLRESAAMGFDLTVHADQFSVGGSDVAVRANAVSADHLEASGDSEIKQIASSDIVAVALPGASIGLGEPFAPVRKLLDAGASVAIASDWNPGSAPQGDLLSQASILATYQKVNTAEIFAGLTSRAAKALKRTDIGCISDGYFSDMQCFITNDFRDILYNQGRLKPSMIWKKGHLAYRNRE